MLLDWLDPDLAVPAPRRVLQLIGTGAVKRSDLLALLSSTIRRARVDQVLRELRQDRLMESMFLPGAGEAVYLLTKEGLKQLPGYKRGAHTAHARLTYHLAVSEVLVKCVEAFGVSGWAWYNDLEAVDELWTLRSDDRASDKDIKSTMPPVSSLVRTLAGDVLWLDIDDAVKGNRPIRESCAQWTRSLDRLEKGLRRVLFVARGERVGYLQQRVTRWSDPRVSMEVCSVDQVVEVLDGSKVTIS